MAVQLWVGPQAADATNSFVYFWMHGMLGTE